MQKNDEDEDFGLSLARSSRLFIFFSRNASKSGDLYC